jgi:hypothetical protein
LWWRKPNKKIKVMAYKEKEVIAKYTKGNIFSDCGEYKVNDLLEMFDETNVTKNALGDYYNFTVNDLVTDDNTTKVNLVVTSECDDMFCYLNKDTVLQNEIDLELAFEIPCSKELDYEFKYQSE